MDKRKTAISIDDDIYEKIKQISKREDRSFSQQVNKILRDFLESHSKLTEGE